MTFLIRTISFFLFFLLLLLPHQSSAEEQNIQFHNGMKALLSKKFAEKEEGIKLIGSSGSPIARETLETLLKGKLFYTKKDKIFVLTQSQGTQYAISNYLTKESIGVVKKRKVKKISINNRLRSLLKSTIASLSIDHPDPQIRLKAVNKLMGNPSPELEGLLKARQAKETDERVKEAIAITLAIGGLYHNDPEQRLEALKVTEGHLHPAIKNELNSFVQREKEPDLKERAGAIIAGIDTQISFYNKVEKLFFGLSLGSVLVLAAIGLAITFGVIGVINMAHGELIMIGAYTTYVLQQLMPDNIAMALFLSIPAAFLVSGITGILIERSVIQFLYGRPLETLLATFGISLVLQQTVRTIFSPLNRSVSTPAWMSGSIELNPVLSLTTNRVTIFIFALVVFAVLYLLLKRTSLGLNVRAVAQNRAMARAMGVNAAKVDALTFGLGSGIAGIAGVALSQLTNVGPNLGQSYIIDSFMVVVFGGVGNLWGTLLGGLSLGVANKFLEPWSGAVLAKIFILVFIILFIQKRPQGLFPQKGRAAE